MWNQHRPHFLSSLMQFEGRHLLCIWQSLLPPSPIFLYSLLFPTWVEYLQMNRGWMCYPRFWFYPDECLDGRGTAHVSGKWVVHKILFHFLKLLIHSPSPNQGYAVLPEITGGFSKPPSAPPPPTPFMESIPRAEHLSISALWTTPRPAAAVPPFFISWTSKIPLNEPV